MKKFEITEEELKALMYEATKTYNLTEYERTEVTYSEGLKMYIDRIIKKFKSEKK